MGTRYRHFGLATLVAIVFSLIATLVPYQPRMAEAQGGILPDLYTLEPGNLHITRERLDDGDLHYLLRFDNTVGNLGGRFEITAEIGYGSPIYQRLYNRLIGGSIAQTTRISTDIVYHPTHNHFHLADFGRYDLLKKNATTGRYQLTEYRGNKTSFCIIDLLRIEDSASIDAGFQYCNDSVQGLSHGWADIYDWQLPDQWIDLGEAGLPDGEYAVQSHTDPYGKLLESDRSNNIGLHYFTVSNGSIVGGDQQVDCFATPSAVQVGATVNVSCNRLNPGDVVDFRLDSNTGPIIGSATVSADTKALLQLTVPDAPQGQHHIFANPRGRNDVHSTVINILPNLILGANSGPVGTTVPYTLTGFGSSETVSIKVNNVEVAQVAVPPQGGASGSFTLPPAANGNATIVAVGVQTGNSSTKQFSVQPTLTLGNNWATVGGALSNALSGFGSSENVTLVLTGGVSPSEGSPVAAADTTLRTIHVSANGSSDFGPTTDLTIPAGVAPGAYTIVATGQSSGATSSRAIEVLASGANTPTATRTPTITRTPSATPSRTPTRTPTVTRTPSRTATAPTTIIGIGSLVEADGATYVRSGPCANYQILYTAPDNTRFSVLSLGEACGDYTWIRVQQTSSGSNQGRIGYMAAQSVSLIATATPTRTSSPGGPSPTRTPTRTPSVSATPSSTRTPTITRTASSTPSITLTPTQTFTPTQTLTPSMTSTATLSPTASNTATPSNTATASNTPTATFTPSATLPATSTRTATTIPSRTSSPTASPIGGFGAGDIVRVNELLNLRSGPGIGFTRLQTLRTGDLLQVTGTGTSAGEFFWIPVTFGGRSGWVASEFVTKVGSATPTRTVTPSRTAGPSNTPTMTRTPSVTSVPSTTLTPSLTTSPSQTVPATNTRTPSVTRTPGPIFTATVAATSIGGFQSGDIVRVTEPVNFRDAPTIYSGVMRVLRTNDQLLVTGNGVSADGYIFIPVRFGSTNGWVASLYITKTGTASPTATRAITATPSRTAVGGSTLTPGPGGFLPGDHAETRVRVNLRSGAGTTASVIVVLAAGTELQVTGYGQSATGYFWVPVRTSGGTNGWIADEFIAHSVSPAVENTATTAPAQVASETSVPLATATSGTVVENPRYDDAVLRWLPEIQVAAANSGLTPAQVAALVALMSGGDPSVVSPLGAVGLTQVKPEEFASAGIGEAIWHDPATNLSFGSALLSGMIANAGSVEGGLATWFGEGCDDSGRCTADYIQSYFSLVASYEAILFDPAAAGYALLPADWVAVIGVPYVGSVPYRFAPLTPTPEPTIEVPPTDEPTIALPPTEEPTLEVPTEIPTEEVPVEEPPVESSPEE